MPLMDGMVMDTIESMQDMGEYYTKKIEVEKRRCLELENKLKVGLTSAAVPPSCGTLDVDAASYALVLSTGDSCEAGRKAAYNAGIR